MSYIGNLPTNVAFVTDTFSGNGSTVAFTTSVAPASTSSILVAVTGVLQDPSTYSVSGTTLTFSAAPPSGTGNISVRYLGVPASGVTTTAYRTVTEFTATAGQTTFSVPSYTAGYIDVYRNGSRLGTADYTATSGTTVVLAAACNAGDLVVTESFYVSSVLNAIPATAGAVTSNYVSSVTSAQVTGTTTNNNAASGYLGEYISSTVPFGSAVSLPIAGTTTTITSISLTAGDWDVSGQVGYEGTGASSTLNWAMAASSTTTSAFGANSIGSVAIPLSNNGIWTLTDLVLNTPLTRYSLSSTTTVYLLARANSTGSGTLIGWGQISARRVR